MASAIFALEGEGADKRLHLSGDWTVTHMGTVSAPLREALGRLQKGRLSFDTTALGKFDTAGAYVLYTALAPYMPDTIDFSEMPEGVQRLLRQAQMVATVEPQSDPPPMDHGLVALLDRTGRGAVHFWDETLDTLAFLGKTLVRSMGVVLRPAKMRWTALVAIMEEAGLDAVPIIAFLSFFVGMVVAFIGATTLSELGAPIFVVELLGFGLLRELAGVLAAIIIAGRTNSAFTAQIGAMKMRQEVDAMTTLGLDPMTVLVAPRVIAMVILLPILTLVAMLSGLAGGMAVSWLTLDISPTVFLNRMQEFVPVSQFWIGLSKAPVFGLAIALIGCRQGLQVGGSVQSLGEHTIKSVVQAIFAIIVIDAFFAIFYMELGL